MTYFYHVVLWNEEPSWVPVNNPCVPWRRECCSTAHLLLAGHEGGVLRENTSDAHKTESKAMVLLSNKSCLMWVRIVPQMVCTWTVIFRGFCVPDEDTCEGLYIRGKHVSHTEIKLVLKGNVSTPEKGQEWGMITVWGIFVWLMYQWGSQKIRTHLHISSSLCHPLNCVCHPKCLIKTYIFEDF